LTADRFVWGPGDVVVIVPDNVAVVDRELAGLAAALRDGCPRVDRRQRFLDLATRMAAWQACSRFEVAARHGIRLVPDPFDADRGLVEPA
jgi:hypothetical protein